MRLLSILFHAAIVFSFSSVMLYMASHNFTAYVAIVAEDNPVEFSQFVFYMLSSVLCRCLAIELRKQQQKIISNLFWLSMLAFFFVAMEEISWGQRVFHWMTPHFLKTVNVQSETSLHNIGDAVLYFRRVFVFAGVYVILSSVIYEGWVEHCRQKKRSIVLPFYAKYLVGVPQYGFYFIPTLMFNTQCKMYDCSSLIDFGIQAWRYQEVGELGFALGCFLILRHHLHMALNDASPNMPSES